MVHFHRVFHKHSSILSSDRVPRGRAAAPSARLPQCYEWASKGIETLEADQGVEDIDHLIEG